MSKRKYLVKKITQGSIYVDANNELVIASSPQESAESHSGYSVYLWNASGRRRTQHTDRALSKATLRQERDFWRDAFRNATGWNNHFQNASGYLRPQGQLKKKRK